MEKVRFKFPSQIAYALLVIFGPTVGILTIMGWLSVPAGHTHLIVLAGIILAAVLFLVGMRGFCKHELTGGDTLETKMGIQFVFSVIAIIPLSLVLASLTPFE